jgi:hypothetical protein
MKEFLIFKLILKTTVTVQVLNISAITCIRKWGQGAGEERGKQY